MILLLDPFDAIVSNKGSIRQVSQNDILDALNMMNEALKMVPHDLIQNVSEIKIINSSGDYYILEQTTFNKFIKKLKNNSKLSCQLLKNSTFQNLKGFSEINIFNDLLLKDDRKYIFFDVFLTNDLIAYYNSISTVNGYRVRKNDYKDWQKIEDVEKYLNICTAMNYQFIGKQTFMDHITESKENIRSVLTDKMVNAVINNKIIKHLCIFNEWEGEEIKKLLSIIYDKFGVFELYYCRRGDNYILPKRSEKLLIFDLDLLSNECQKRLIKELFTGEYKNSLVIIFSRTNFDDRPFPELKKWVSTDTNSELYRDIYGEVFRWSETMDSKIKEYESIIELIETSEQQKKKYIKKLKEYMKGKLTLNQEGVDFWYDLNSFELFDKNKSKEWYEQITKKYFPDIQKTKYEFRQEIKNWVIIVNGIDSTTKIEKKKKQIPFTKSKAIRYLVYIIKYFNVHNSISFEDLSRSISKWVDGSEKVVKYNTFSESIVRLFEAYPFLKPIDKYLYYNEKGKGCYYQQNSEIEIDLDAIEIPYIHLDNPK